MIIGVTGGFCTGKSSVAKIFKSFGAKVIDLDKLAHKALKRDTKSFDKIVKEFGKDILVNNAISRSRLAKKVFGNKKRLAKLNSIVHPTVISQMQGLIDKFDRSGAVVVEAPLLFEARLENYFDYIIVVKTNKDTEIKRAVKKLGLSRAEVLKRIGSQIPLAKKIKMADLVIDNEGPINNTHKQAGLIWHDLINRR